MVLSRRYFVIAMRRVSLYGNQVLVRRQIVSN
jgi:hypothetical protein